MLDILTVSIENVETKLLHWDLFAHVCRRLGCFNSCELENEWSTHGLNCSYACERCGHTHSIICT